MPLSYWPVGNLCDIFFWLMTDVTQGQQTVLGCVRKVTSCGQQDHSEQQSSMTFDWVSVSSFIMNWSFKMKQTLASPSCFWSWLSFTEIVNLFWMIIGSQADSKASDTVYFMWLWAEFLDEWLEEGFILSHGCRGLCPCHLVARGWAEYYGGIGEGYRSVCISWPTGYTVRP